MTTRLRRAARRRLGPRDCRGKPGGVLRVLDRHGWRGVVADVPLGRLRTFGPIGFVPTRDSRHPFVLTARGWLEEGREGYEGSPLQAYYEAVTPGTAADVLDLPDVPGLVRLSAVEADLPWVARSGPVVRQKRDAMMRADAAEFGRPLTIEDGWNNLGPVSPAKAALELERVLDVTRSIAATGYRVLAPKDHVLGFVLRSGDDYAVVVWGGEHRVPALAALGHETVPLLLFGHRVADRRDAAAWPAVREGALTRTQALRVFDRLLVGRLPTAVRDAWL